MTQFAEAGAMPVSLALDYHDDAISAEPVVLTRTLVAMLDSMLEPARVPLRAATTWHPLTREAALQSRTLPRAQALAVRQILEDFAQATSGLDVAAAPALRIGEAEDGSILLEWTFADRRLGFSFEPSPEDSGWYFVLSNGSSERYEAGTMDQLEMVRLVTMALNP